MLNKVMLIGRLGRDPELRYSASGMPMANLRIATDESYTDRDGNKVDRTEWHSVVVFQRQAENCANYLAKGSLVFVEGSLQTRKWQDQQGQDRYTTEIKAQRVQFLDRKGSAGQGDYASGPSDQQYGGDQQFGGGQQAGGGKQYGGGQQGGGRGSAPQRQQPRNPEPEDLGPAFPSEASGMDDVPF
ncbi:Single-stranded DNA-binding protein [uncultured delta proteobacterium]|uniref:Single-stranded DNA-binding protein n=1 Tax=uncultured delta proteobacterium TaxID=34034 RepID=A0A212J4Y7_9DELT|nr:Single-stranded DNA-binding protein [uncultured delta proteobacterium]